MNTQPQVWRWTLGADRRYHAVDIASDHHPSGWHRTRCERLVSDVAELTRDACGAGCAECLQ